MGGIVHIQQLPISRPVGTRRCCTLRELALPYALDFMLRYAASAALTAIKSPSTRQWVDSASALFGRLSVLPLPCPMGQQSMSSCFPLFVCCVQNWAASLASSAASTLAQVKSANLRKIGQTALDLERLHTLIAKKAASLGGGVADPDASLVDGSSM